MLLYYYALWAACKLLIFIAASRRWWCGGAMTKGVLCWASQKLFVVNCLPKKEQTVRMTEHTRKICTIPPSMSSRQQYNRQFAHTTHSFAECNSIHSHIKSNFHALFLLLFLFLCRLLLLLLLKISVELRFTCIQIYYFIKLLFSL